jgi:hypothetical protein
MSFCDHKTLIHLITTDKTPNKAGTRQLHASMISFNDLLSCLHHRFSKTLMAYGTATVFGAKRRIVRM